MELSRTILYSVRESKDICSELVESKSESPAVYRRPAVHKQCFSDIVFSLRQRSYVFALMCWFVCRLIGLLRKSWTNYYKIFGRQEKQIFVLIQFWRWAVSTLVSHLICGYSHGYIYTLGLGVSFMQCKEDRLARIIPADTDHIWAL